MLFDLDEIWHTRSRIKWLNYMQNLNFLRSPLLKVLWLEAE